MKSAWLLFLLECWQDEGMCHDGEVQVVHVEDATVRSSGDGIVVTDFRLRPLHGEAPWTLTLPGGVTEDIHMVFAHGPTHPKVGSRVLVWHHPVDRWVKHLVPLRWWQPTPSPKRLERRFREACANVPPPPNPLPVPSTRWGN